jgi:hypothetical protein
MPLSLEELQDIQADAMADDIEIDFEKMSLWSKGLHAIRARARSRSGFRPHECKR